MLIVRRRVGQAILIGDQVEVHVLEVSPGRVKLGIVAPREVTVMRAEVKLTREANIQAAAPVPPEKLEDLARRLKAEREAPKKPEEDSGQGELGEPTEGEARQGSPHAEPNSDAFRA